MCAPTRRALEQIARDDPRVTVEVFNLVLDKERAAEYDVDRVPAVIVETTGGGRIRYYGAPLGRELPTLTQALAMAAEGKTLLAENSRAALKALEAAVVVKVFFTPACVYCPQMIALANQAAIESPMVRAIAIDATEYPDLVQRYNVNGVPKTIINDSVELLGAVPEEDFIRAFT